jgi:hypothetical protein
MSARARDFLGSILMLAFVASLWVQRDYNTPFGGIFPDIVMGCLVVLVVATMLLMFTPWPAISEGKQEGKGTGFHWSDMVVVGAIMLAWVILLRRVGFVATGLLGFGSISWFLNERRSSFRGVAESFGIGAAMVALLVLVFEHLLKVPLPKGSIFG